MYFAITVTTTDKYQMDEKFAYYALGLFFMHILVNAKSILSVLTQLDRNQ